MRCNHAESMLPMVITGPVHQRRLGSDDWRPRKHNVMRHNHAESNAANSDHWITLKKTRYIG